MNDGKRSRDWSAQLYVYPSKGILRDFHCRWASDFPINISISGPPKARELIRLAMRAWEDLGLGLHFRETSRRKAMILVNAWESPVANASGVGSGRAIADCYVHDTNPWYAELQSAQVDIALLTPKNIRGDTRALTDEEFTGLAIHELGHALGYQGHSDKRGAAMVRDRFISKLLGRRVLTKKKIKAPGVEQLYSLPAGRIRTRVQTGNWRTETIDKMSQIAKANGLQGPFVQVGDKAGRVFWRDRDGLEYGVRIPRVSEVMSNPNKLSLVPERKTRLLLSE